ncbi:MAG TPA: hypothetical protein VK975_06715 [Acidimicrobiales bacterium]|nr:hypothetical protein [Acidimicrobiales bacterium]
MAVGLGLSLYDASDRRRPPGLGSGQLDGSFGVPNQGTLGVSEV